MSRPTYKDMHIEDVKTLYKQTLEIYNQIRDIGNNVIGSAEPYYSEVWRNSNLWQVNVDKLKFELLIMEDVISKHDEVVGEMRNRLNDICNQISALKDEQIKIYNDFPELRP